MNCLYLLLCNLYTPQLTSWVDTSLHLLLLKNSLLNPHGWVLILLFYSRVAKDLSLTSC